MHTSPSSKHEMGQIKKTHEALLWEGWGWGEQFTTLLFYKNEYKQAKSIHRQGTYGWIEAYLVPQQLLPLLCVLSSRHGWRAPPQTTLTSGEFRRVSEVTCVTEFLKQSLTKRDILSGPPLLQTPFFFILFRWKAELQWGGETKRKKEIFHPLTHPQMATSQQPKTTSSHQHGC